MERRKAGSSEGISKVRISSVFSTTHRRILRARKRNINGREGKEMQWREKDYVGKAIPGRSSGCRGLVVWYCAITLDCWVRLVVACELKNYYCEDVEFDIVLQWSAAKGRETCRVMPSRMAFNSE